MDVDFWVSLAAFPLLSGLYHDTDRDPIEACATACVIAVPATSEKLLVGHRALAVVEPRHPVP